MPEMDKATKIRQKYALERERLNNCFAKDLAYEGIILDERGYHIARRKIVLERQKALLDGGFLVNDEMTDENDQPTGTYELDWINAELLTGVKDRLLVCPHDPYPHSPYPIKVRYG